MILYILWRIFDELWSFRIGTSKPHFFLKIVIFAFVRTAFLRALRVTMIMINGRNSQVFSIFIGLWGNNLSSILTFYTPNFCGLLPVIVARAFSPNIADFNL
jgi:hypothetical protein